MIRASLVHHQHDQIDRLAPPSCKPQLPPVIVMGAGPLQPFTLLSVVRHVATPFPCLPPNPTATLIIEGITIMHFASLKIFVGIPLSGVPMISSKTLAELLSRLTISDSLPCVSNLAGFVAFVSVFWFASVEVCCACWDQTNVDRRSSVIGAAILISLIVITLTRQKRTDATSCAEIPFTA